MDIFYYLCARMKRIKNIGLLPRIIIAIILGVVAGNFLTAGFVRVFITFNYVFSQFLGFLIPLIIIGLVAPAISDIGRSAGKLLLWTVGVAYLDTILAGLLAYGTGSLHGSDTCHSRCDGCFGVCLPYGYRHCLYRLYGSEEGVL